MCIGDWRLGRLIRHEWVTFDPAVGNRTFPANKQRVGIGFSGQTSSNLTQNISLQWDFSLTVMFLPEIAGMLLFTLETHGDLPTREWIVRQDSNVDLVTVTQFFLPENVLAAGIEEFYSKYKINQ